MKLVLSKSSLIVISLGFSLVALIGTGLASASNSPPETRLMCTRKSWASSDKCKDLAVASKNAPKDLKKEIERLASLTATSYQEVLKEHSVNVAKFQSEYSKWQIASSQHKKEQDKIQEACFKSLGIRFDPNNYHLNWPSKCMALYKLGPSVPYQQVGGPARDKWAQAWLDLTTLAKAFPQYIQPSQLSTLLNAYEPSKTCVANKNCLPRSISG